MPQARKQRQPEAPPTIPVEQPKRRNRYTPYFIAAAVVVALLAIVSVPYYQQYIGPFRQIVLTVDNTTIRMSYLLQRIIAADSDGLSMMEALTNEQLIRHGAPRYGITVTEKDIDDYLRQQAAGTDNHTVSDIEYREWYRQTINESRLPESRFREMVGNSIYATRLQEYLSTDMPKEVEHVFLYGILLSSYDDAVKAKERWAAGEDFSKLAEELSIDQSTPGSGGEIGWLPEGASGGVFDQAFSMNVGDVSDPGLVPSSDPTADPSTTPQIYYIIYVKDKAIRPIEDQYLSSIQAKVFQDWLSGEHEKHTVKWHFNSEINAWINWQLTKYQGSSSTSSTSG